MPLVISPAELESRIQERLMGPNPIPPPHIPDKKCTCIMCRSFWSMGPDPDKHGIFRDHNCWKCKDGEYACVNGNPRQCEFPHARND